MGLDAGILNNGHDDVTIKNGFVHEFLYGVQLNPGTARQRRPRPADRAGRGGGDRACRRRPGRHRATRSATTCSSGTSSGIALYSGTRHAVIRDNTLAATTGEGAIFARVRERQPASRGTRSRCTGGSGVHMRRRRRQHRHRERHQGAAAASRSRRARSCSSRTTTSSCATRSRRRPGGVIGRRQRQPGLNNDVTGTTGPGVVLELASNNVVRGNELRRKRGRRRGQRGLEQHRSRRTTPAARSAPASRSASSRRPTSCATTPRAGTAATASRSRDSSVFGQGNVIERQHRRLQRRRRHLRRGRRPHDPRQRRPAERRLGHLRRRRRPTAAGTSPPATWSPTQCFGVVVHASASVPGAPDTWIVEGPADIDTGLAGSPVRTAATRASPTWASTRPTPLTDLVFECRIDSTNPLAWEDCEYPAEYLNLSPGEHTFEVRAIDMLGQGLADPTPATLHVDATCRCPSGVAPPPPILDVVAAGRDVAARSHLHLPLARARRHVPVQGRLLRLGAVRVRGRHVHEPGRVRGRRSRRPTSARTPSTCAPSTSRATSASPRRYTWTLLGITVVFTDGPGFTPASGGPGGDPGDRRPDAEHDRPRSSSRPTSPTSSSSAASTASARRSVRALRPRRSSAELA